MIEALRANPLMALVATIGAVMIGCTSRTPIAPDPARATEARVYEAVFQAKLADGVRELRVIDQTSMGEPGGSRFMPARRGAFWTGLPSGLVEQLDSIGPRPTSLRTVGLPRWIHLLTRREWKAMLDDAKRRNEIVTGGVYLVSPVALTADSADALVYMEEPCSGLCGSGSFFHAQRDSIGQWHVRDSALAWIG